LESGEIIVPNDLSVDGYSVRIARGDFVWWRNQIFNLKNATWRYVGVLHEYATCDKEQPNCRKLEGNYNLTARTEGARNVGITPQEKYSRDAETIKKALEDEPDNQRYWFYLAQSYFDSQQWDKSREAYLKRAEAGGWAEEVFYSLYRAAIIDGIQNKPLEIIAQSFLKSFQAKPDRAEPLFNLARIYRLNGMPAVAYMYARMGLEIPYPQNDILFIQEEVYRYGILDEVGATAYYAGKPHVGYAACKKLIDENLVSEGDKARVIENLRSYEKILGQMQQHEMQQNMNQQMKEYAEKQKKKQEKKESKKNKVKKPTKTPSIHTQYKSRKKAKS